MKRENFAVTANVEDKALNYLVAKLPNWTTPDMLTLLAFLSTLLGGFFYILAGNNLEYLFFVSLCLVIHWFGDGLDGRVARYRKISRPNYGYYIDHILDVVSVVLLVGGISISTLTLTNSWTIALIVMVVISAHTFLRTNAYRTFKFSMGMVGPTESRIGLIVVNIVVYLLKNPVFILLGNKVTLFDLFGVIALVVVSFVLISEFIKTALDLNKLDSKKLKG